MRKIASSYSKSLISTFRNKIEFQNDEVQETNGEVSFYTVRYRRIFRKGIVLGNVSYVSLRISGDGRPAEIIIKCPRFIRIPGSKEAIVAEEAIDNAYEIYEETGDAERGYKKASPLKADVKGIALAWRSVVSTQGDRIITPCYAFKGEILLENDQTAPRFIEVPRLLKYFR